MQYSSKLLSCLGLMQALVHGSALCMPAFGLWAKPHVHVTHRVEQQASAEHACGRGAGAVSSCICKALAGLVIAACCCVCGPADR